MNIFFTILSICYIVGIFLWADSPIVEELSAFNPYSFLHIPLYGILTILLIFARLPLNLFNEKKPMNSSNPSNLPREMRNLFHRGSINHLTPGSIAFVVAVADEIHQAYIPGRNASITDVLLDVVGIVLVLIVIHQIRRKKVIRLLGK
jgi:hypothetical protein